MNPKKNNFSKALALLRALYDINQVQLAALCHGNYSVQSISRFENGYSPPLQLCNDVCTIFGIDDARMDQIVMSPDNLSEAKILLILAPSKESKTIEIKHSSVRVIRLIRLLKGYPLQVAYTQSSKYHKALSPGYVSKIESMLFERSIELNTLLHFSEIYSIKPEKFMHYIIATEEMSTVQAAMYIASDLTKKNKRSSN